jgi:hypothetical protein
MSVLLVHLDIYFPQILDCSHPFLMGHVQIVLIIEGLGLKERPGCMYPDFFSHERAFSSWLSFNYTQNAVGREDPDIATPPE